MYYYYFVYAACVECNLLTISLLHAPIFTLPRVLSSNQMRNCRTVKTYGRVESWLLNFPTLLLVQYHANGAVSSTQILPKGLRHSAPLPYYLSPQSPISLTPLLNNPTPKLRILLLRHPHLMERAQTRQHRPPNPRPILPLHTIRIRQHPNPRIGEHGLQIRVQAIRQLLDQRARARQDDVAEQVRAGVDVAGV